MKIAIDTRTAGGEKAGKGWFTFHITQNLLKQDQKNQYILYSKEKIPGFEQFKNATVKIIRAPSALWHLKTAHDIKKEKVDIFFAPSSYIIPAILPKSIKAILIIHDLVAFLFPETHNKKATIIEQFTLKKALKKATHIITVSKNTKQDIIRRFKTDEDKISVIYNSAGEKFKPIEKNTLTTFIRETNLPQKFFLAVSTIIPRKNYKNLIRAFAKISEKYPDQHLIIVGNKGWKYEEIDALIRKNYLHKKVHVLGYLSEKSLISLYNLAQALVFPSFYEGFGIPPLEAMKCGCPVIASHTSSIPEVTGDAALLINPENPNEIATAMLKIIKDKGLVEKLRGKGFMQADKFSWEDSAKELLKIIQKSH